MCKTRSVLAGGVARGGDAILLLLFHWAALLDGLVPLKGVLASEGFSTEFAEEGFISGVGIPVAFKVVLAIE